MLEYDFQMIRWLEKQGREVAYSTSLDTHSRPDLLWRHQAWISLGHDEYWSHEMRANIEAALQQGLHLGFFGANDVYWQSRFEDSPLGPDHVLVCYKLAALDPFFTGAGGQPKDLDRVTVRFRDPPVNRPTAKLSETAD